MQFEAIKKDKTIVQKVVDQMLTNISIGKLKPGDTIPVDSKLAETFKVSRSTIREAMIVLEARDMIEIVPRKGAVIRDIPKDIPTPAVVDIRLDLSLDYLRELVECFASTLEGKIKLVCRKMTPEDLLELKIIYAEIERCARLFRKGNIDSTNYDVFANAYIKWHRYLGKATHNMIHESLTDALISKLREYIPLLEVYIAQEIDVVRLRFQTEKELLLALEARDCQKVDKLASHWAKEVGMNIIKPLGL